MGDRAIVVAFGFHLIKEDSIDTVHICCVFSVVGILYIIIPRAAWLRRAYCIRTLFRATLHSAVIAGVHNVGDFLLPRATRDQAVIAGVKDIDTMGKGDGVVISSGGVLHRNILTFPILPLHLTAHPARIDSSIVVVVFSLRAVRAAFPAKRLHVAVVRNMLFHRHIVGIVR